MYVCICAAVTDTELRSCIAGGARTVEEVGEMCGAGTGCGGCQDHVDVFLAAAHSPSEIAGLPLTA
ncbi:(2Fe-2S)-binding protein [Pseudonocardia acidicola]|uniref:Bacterioferritin-associated ferredoxin n=1 Tax=Pseudonocardia acidicola TaxID=2724939 RepID=A0ABX1SC44_9PSEU|nr:(2Fe-2S)-binding protein [Pseudonocardia acidicola]NMH98112.1 (2Fe-2S)-binding protein [Pseudonocardia acidicola]